MDEERSPEELALLMQAYKKELAQIYRASSLRRGQLVAAGAPEARLRDCESAMRGAIEELKQKYGIRY